jgi:hypothetical protein
LYRLILYIIWESHPFGWTFAPGDKVMQIENDYDKKVYNGDVGYVMGVEAGGGALTAIVDGRSVTYGFGELASHLCLRRFRRRRSIGARCRSARFA